MSRRGNGCTHREDDHEHDSNLVIATMARVGAEEEAAVEEEEEEPRMAVAAVEADQVEAGACKGDERTPAPTRRTRRGKRSTSP
jgi:hypothetical protein